MPFDFGTFVSVSLRALALVGFGLGLYVYSRTYSGETEELKEKFATTWLVVAIGAGKMKTFIKAASNAVDTVVADRFGPHVMSPQAVSVSLHFCTASAMLWWAYLEMMWRPYPSVTQATSFLIASGMFVWTAIQARSPRTWRRWVHYGLSILLGVVTLIGSISPERVWTAANSVTDRTATLAFVHPPVTLLSLFLGAHAVRAVVVVLVATALQRWLTRRAIASESVERMFIAFVLGALVVAAITLGLPWLLLNVVWRNRAIGDAEVLNLVYAAGTVVALVPVVLFVILSAAAVLNGIAAFVARIVYPAHKTDWEKHSWQVLTLSLVLLWWAIGPLLKTWLPSAFS